MHKSRWVRRILLAVVWGLAASTWASIGHHLGGLPDVGPILVIGVVALILAWPQGTRRTDGKLTPTTYPSVARHPR
jgi:hypothetical protein